MTLPKQKIPFGILRHGQPIRESIIQRKYDPHITIENALPGMVAEYEAREAAIYCNYNWTEFTDISSQERAKSIAQYREHHRIEANMNDAAEKSSKAGSK